MDLSFLGIYSDIGFDLGSTTTRICVKGKGLVLSEPSVVALDKESKKVLAVGNEAKDMLGRTPDNIIAVCPVRDGVIADFTATAAMIKAFLYKAAGKRPIIKPRVAVGVPSGITDVERRAVIEAFTAVGARSVALLEEPVAAAVGAGLPVEAAQGSMIVNIGSGTCEVAVISLGGIVSARSIRCAGDAMNNAIVSYMRHQYAVTIGTNTAEELKLEIGSATRQNTEGTYDVKGRETATGLPRNVRVNAAEIRGAISDVVTGIVNAVLDTLEDTPPELAADVLSSGIVITGNGAYLRGIDEVIENATGIKTRIVDGAENCVVLGTEVALSKPVILRRSEVGRRR
ncbi:MAG: rod shape-determining protein [Eubacteriales bacterium]|nr:rod shape-determining protein [Eubacteriales bacterium]